MKRMHNERTNCLMKNLIIFYFLFILPNLLFGSRLSSSVIYAKGPTLLTRYSLEDYLPEIGDQGDVGSCVGWASAYYGLTVVKRIEHGRNYPVFSALSAYNRYCFLNRLNI